MPVNYEFGPFRLNAQLGILLRGTEPIAVGKRAVALLQMLIDRAGEAVAKEELIAKAWPGLVVEDSNLTVQMAALRKVLSKSGGATWIETLARRGYRYVGPRVMRYEAENSADRNGAALPLPTKPSIVVLPFADLGDNAEQTYFTDGIVDDIVTGLARIKWLFVIGRGTTFAYKGQTIQPRQVGLELGVRYLLDGSVRRTADRVRINVQLVDATNGAQVWAERFERQLDDIFALQDEIAAAVVAALEPGLKRAEIERVRRKRPDSLDAYELVLKAQPDVDTGMPDQVLRALTFLEQSLALLPTYALAHGNAARCHHSLYLRAGLKEENRLASLEHAQAAITYGRDDALALTYAGFAIGMDGHDRAAAFTAFDAALALSPSSAVTYIYGSIVNAWGGETARAIEWGELGLRLSPLDPSAFAAHHSVSLGNFKLGHFDQAANAARKSVHANPAHSISYMLLAAALVRLGRLEDASDAAAAVVRLQPNFGYGKQFKGVNCDPVLAASLGSALGEIGLPQ